MNSARKLSLAHWWTILLTENNELYDSLSRHLGFRHWHLIENDVSSPVYGKLVQSPIASHINPSVTFEEERLSLLVQQLIQSIRRVSNWRDIGQSRRRTNDIEISFRGTEAPQTDVRLGSQQYELFITDDRQWGS